MAVVAEFLILLRNKDVKPAYDIVIFIKSLISYSVVLTFLSVSLK